MYLLDTNVVSEIVRPRPDQGVKRRLTAYGSTELFASEITRYELRYGACLRADADTFWARLMREVLPVVTWLEVTDAVSMRGAEIAARLRGQGRTAGDFDALIAASAAVHGLTLVTRNLRHFEAVPGLRLENWFAAS